MRVAPRSNPLQRRDPCSLWISLLAIAVLANAIGCASDGAKAPERVDPLADAPAWVTRGCRLHWQDQQARTKVVCGIGSAGPNRNPIAARETAIARARSAIARSIEVTIESLVHLEESGDPANDGILRSIVHQLTSTSLPACQTESVWLAENGEVFALVSLRVAKLQQSLRSSSTLSASARDDLAERAAVAFAAMNASLDADADGSSDPRRDSE